MSQAVLGLNSFNGGELDPRAEGRSDLPQYRNSARKLLNLIPQVNGSVTRRPGTQHAAAALHPTQRSRLIPFRIGDGENYILELGAFKMRVFKDDGPMVYPNRPLRASEYIPGSSLFVMDDGHGFYHGQEVEFATANNPDGAPTGLALDTTYFVCLPRGFLCNSFAGSFTTAEAANITAGMGPYTVISDNNDAVAWGGPFGGPWYTENPLTGTTLHMLHERFGATGTRFAVTGSYTVNVAVYPHEEALAKTLRLATDPDDLHGSITAPAGAWNFASTMSPVRTTEEIIFRHPYSATQIWELNFGQSFDRIYFYHKDFPIHDLTRWNVGAFRFGPMRFLETPYGELSPVGSDVTVTWSAIANQSRGRTPRATAARSIFNAGHVGQSFQRQGGVRNDSVGAEEWIIGTIERVNGANAFQTAGTGLVYQTFDTLIAGPKLPMTAHPFVNGDEVCVADGGNGLPSDLAEHVPYFVINAGVNDLELSLTSGGASVLTTLDGGLNNLLISMAFQAVDQLSVNVNTGYADRVERLGVWSNGEPPTGCIPGKLYRLRTAVRNPAQRFYLEHYGGSDDGVPVTFTSIGHGQLFFSADTGSTSIVGADKATADVRTTISGGGANYAEGTADFRWRIGDLGPVLGWPGAGALHEQRHVLCGSYTFPNRIWLSQTGVEVDFGPLQSSSFTLPLDSVTSKPFALLDTGAIAIDPVSNSTSGIRWALGHNTLLVGTGTEIFEIFASSDRQAITPGNVNVRVVTSIGANAVIPVRAGTDIFYVTANGRQVQALLFDGLSAASAPVDLTALSGHVTDSEIIQIAWQQEPYKVAWCVRDDGRLYGMTYDRDQTVAGWHRHELGGSFGSDSFGHVQSVVAVPHKDASMARGDYDRLWMSVFRDINGSPVQHIEFLTRGFENWSLDAEAHHVDAAPAPYSGGATTTPFAAMTWLEAETLEIWADAAELLPEVVAGGSITIDTASAYVVAGLGFTTEYNSLPLDAVVDDETTIQAVKKRIVDLFLRLNRSHAGVAGQNSGNATSLGNAADGVNAPFTGLLNLRGFQHEYDEEATVFLQVTGPVPFHLNSLIARMEWADR